MFCINCGKQIEEGAGFCPFCGAAQNAGQQNTQQQNAGQQYTQQPGGMPNQQYQQMGGQYQNSPYQNPQSGGGNDTGSFLWAIPGIFLALVGFILFFVLRKEKPKSAKMALIGACVGVVINVLYMMS